MSKPVLSSTEVNLNEIKWRRYDRCFQTIQIALIVIVLSGVAISMLSHYGYLDHVFFYIGFGSSGVALISLGVLSAYKTNQLRDAIKKTQSFSDLKEIVESIDVSTNLHVSCFGSRKIHIAGIQGDVSVDDLAFRVEGLVEKSNFAYSEEERVHGEQIVKLVTNLFEDSDRKADEKNCFSRFCYYFPNIFSLLSVTATIHGRWFYGNGEGADSWFDKVVSRRPKDLLPRFFA